MINAVTAVFRSGSANSLPACALQTLARRLYSTPAEGFGRKEVIYHLENVDDPEAVAAIKSYLRQEFQKAAQPGAAAPVVTEEGLELTAQIEQKYVAAQIVEVGLQNISVPLSAAGQNEATAVKRYVAQLNTLGRRAGLPEPITGLRAKLQACAAPAETVKDFLGRAQPYMSPEFYSSLMEGLQEVESQLGVSVAMDGASEGYKKFLEKVKATAQAHKIPHQLLGSSPKSAATGDEDARSAQTQRYLAWVQSAQAQDAQVEIDQLRAEATRLLDTHLSKTAEQIRKEQQVAMTQIMRKLESAKGATWAQKYQEDLQYVNWFDSQVAKDPKNGPVAAATSSA